MSSPRAPEPPEPDPPPPVLAVRAAVIEDPGPLLALLPDQPALAWVRDGEGMVGWGEAARWEGSGPDRFGAGRRWLADLAARAAIGQPPGQPAGPAPGGGLIAFGAFGFGDEAPDERDPTLRASVLIVPALVVGRRDGAWWVSAATPAETEAGIEADEASEGGIAGDGEAGAGGDPVRALRSGGRPAAVRPIGSLSWEPGACSAPAWGAAVARAIEAIRAGRADKVVLARDLIARADAPIDPRAVLSALAGRYPSCWTFSVDGLIGATPELLVRAERGIAESRVLAGTLRRQLGPAADSAAAELEASEPELEASEREASEPAPELKAAERVASERELKASEREASEPAPELEASEREASEREASERELERALLASAKDRREHELSVQSVVAALAPHCRALSVPPEPFVLHLPNVLHLASDLRGELADAAS
ncbi:MAG: chorismate-binding protein, partial [Frankiaceae bacterium]|nr:chorismate-binding protein [Frankiaceae bacterium]